jgi:hypothetical protein
VTEPEPELVENRYKTALGDDLSSIRGQAAVCSFSFSSVRRALDNGAWQSTTADAFSGSLQANQTAAQEAGNACEAALVSAHASEPDKVPPNHPHARW